MISIVENNDKNKRILIVDDVPTNIDLLKEILSEYYQVQIAKSGALALDIISRTLPDLILLDIMMPDMNGFEVCKKIKSKPETADIPIIFLTAVNDAQIEQEGFALGCVDFITKPITPLTTLSRVATHLKLAADNLLNKKIIENRTRELDDALESAIGMLGEVSQLNDTDTGVHMWRMADYSAALAKAIGWDDDQVELLKLAAPLHDTGKVGIPHEILKSPNKLTDEQWDIMRQHTVIGHQILIKSEAPLFKLAAEVALGHHEKWDGSGYPFGLSGEEIPLSARIVSLADVFDALTMARPYKRNWSMEEALDYIRKGAYTHFDPMLVECFLSIEDELKKIQDKWSAVH
ncbi:putative two-component system response regulator [Marinomonas alcarazii]|uniref:Putative two-component system response regulator n=1 Tax=Marinomonas alcarazii TaxID=491949 RepID=A0A318V4K8_9GAMM|nr:HD domain-containing phosphohydrolase [Marinomonas alcarazii]PYF82953.1 putative two-component system response regulator [Marinomonas alcarazii]